jgi:hypothetical protein
VKFFLNVSKKEQKRRFLARIDEKDNNWKFSKGYANERGHWDDYMKAYTEAIAAPFIHYHDPALSRLILAEYIRHACCSAVAPSTIERRKTYSPMKYCLSPGFVIALILTGMVAYSEPAAPSTLPGPVVSNSAEDVFAKPLRNCSNVCLLDSPFPDQSS